MALTDQFIKKQKQRLKEKRREAVENLARLNKESIIHQPDTNVVDDEDDASEFVEIDETNQQISELQALIDQIDDALQAIKVGKYGLDKRTGEPILQERLEAYPEATTAG